MSTPHRDALEAALARVAALEAEVRELEAAAAAARAGQGEAGVAEERLRVERDHQRGIAKQYAEELQQARADLAAMQAPARIGMPTAEEHNLTRVPASIPGSRSLGVACAACATRGQERELVTIISNSSLGPLGACPACGAVAIVRT